MASAAWRDSPIWWRTVRNLAPTARTYAPAASVCSSSSSGNSFPSVSCRPRCAPRGRRVAAHPSQASYEVLLVIGRILVPAWIGTARSEPGRFSTRGLVRAAVTLRRPCRSARAGSPLSQERIAMTTFPYHDRFEVNRTLPEKGRSRAEILEELRTMATEEDAVWESGKCSGTMYCGDRDHYRFLTEAFGFFAHVNPLQRDMCPSSTKFEAEIIAMTLDLLHAEAVEGTTPAGLVTTGGTGSIAHAMLAYREHANQERGVTRPNVIKPETAHPAFDKACHLFGIELRRAPVDPDSTLVDVGWVED